MIRIEKTSTEITVKVSHPSYERLEEARALLKMFDVDALVFDAEGGYYCNLEKAPKRCYKVLVKPTFASNRLNWKHPQGYIRSTFTQTLSYDSPAALFAGVKRLIKRKTDEQ